MPIKMLSLMCFDVARVCNPSENRSRSTAGPPPKFLSKSFPAGERSMFLIYFFVAVGMVITLAMGALYFNNARRMTLITAGRVVRSEEREVLRKDSREFETD